MIPTHSTPVHVCIATGQNAANLIPLEQFEAQDIWILETPSMRANASHLETALKKTGRRVNKVALDDSTPHSLKMASEQIAEKLDGRHVVLHVTGGTKLMVLALRDGLRLVEAGSGKLDIVYADTRRQQIDWLGERAQQETMADVLDLRKLLVVQGYRIQGESRHAAAQTKAQPRAALTRELGEKSGQYGKSFSAVGKLANRAAHANGNGKELTQFFDYTPGGQLARLLKALQKHAMLQWNGEDTVTFTNAESAAYLAGGWIEEFVLLKLAGGLGRPGYFSTNLKIRSVDGNVANEIDAMLVNRNRALLIECKTGKQQKAQEAIYKIAQVKDKLAGTEASALYLSAQTLGEADMERARSYGVAVLCGDEVAQLVPWLKKWLTT